MSTETQKQLTNPATEEREELIETPVDHETAFDDVALSAPKARRHRKTKLLTTTAVAAVIALAAMYPGQTRDLANSVVTSAQSVTEHLTASAPAQASASAVAPATTVKTIKVTTKNLREWDTYTGQFRASESVAIHARVSGYLEGIHFEDGQIVQQGDLLFTIDRRPFETALAEAQGELTAAKARLKNAQEVNRRGQRLVKRQIISQAVADDRMQSLREAEAQVLTSEARVKRAKLNLSFTEIRAPVSGRVSDNSVSVGALIVEGAANGTELTNVVSLSPIEFEFTVSEADYLKYVRLDRSGARPGSRETPNPVQLRLMDEDQFKHRGRMKFVDNQFNGSTGTMRGRAVFDNAGGLFTPGMFAKLRLVGSAEYDAVLIPDVAVQTDQSRKFVWVVNRETGGSIAERRNIELGPETPDGRIVRSGLTGGEEIVVSGTQFVQSGVALNPKPAQPSKFASARGARSTSQ